MEEVMSVSEVLSLLSSVAASIAAVIAYLGREAVSALQKQHDSDLRRLEESHKSELARQMEEFKRTLSFFGSVDTELRGLRIKSYSELWRTTRALPRWPIDESFTYAKLRTHSEELRNWYFGKDGEVPGGMLLTEDAAQAYRNLQIRIAEALGAWDPAKKLNPAEYEIIRELGSTMRTELTRDLLSRRETPGSAISNVELL
jgi:hypothetical protein